MKSFSYAFGIIMGNLIMRMCPKKLMNLKEFFLAIEELFTDTPSSITSEEANKIVKDTLSAEATAVAGDIKAAGIEFLEENKKNSNINVTASGLQYEIILKGQGKQPGINDTVRCHYRGTLIDGKEFDSSYKRNQPIDFNLQRVIKGWTEGLLLMNEGSIYKFYIPYELGYGEKGAGILIPPYAVLIFEVELIKVL